MVCSEQATAAGGGGGGGSGGSGSNSGSRSRGPSAAHLPELQRVEEEVVPRKDHGAAGHVDAEGERASGDHKLLLGRGQDREGRGKWRRGVCTHGRR